MTLRAHSLISIILLSAVSMAHAASFNAPTGSYAPNQVLVQFKPNTSTAMRSQTSQNFGAQSLQALATSTNWSVANLPAGQSVAQAVAAYANNPNVAAVQPNYIYHTMAVPNDPQYGQLWAAKNTGQTIVAGSYVPTTGTAANDMNLEAAWNVQTDCSTTIVAVVDSGVNYTSTDLAANMWNGGAAAPWHGWNFVGAGSNDPMDLNGHGTHVAGTIGAVGNNAIGVTGVCWKASIMAVRVLDAQGSGTTASIIQGVDFAILHGVKIINMSLGGQGPFDPAYSAAITRAQTANVLVVVAAGNEANGNDTTSARYPCNFTQPNLICVAALDQNYALANFSNWGATSVDVGAPGTNILSTWNGVHTTIRDPLNAGWTFTSTTSTLAAPSGWGYLRNANTGATFIGEPVDAATGWGTKFYNANTDDRIYKTFNLAGVNYASVSLIAAANVNAGDTLNLNLIAAASDPFAVGGTNVLTGSNMADGYTYNTRPTADISACISATCTVGLQLKSALNSTGAIGVVSPSFSISTVTLNTTSYNTINGTSMATPQVAGVAALVWSHNPQFTYADVANAIKDSGRPTLSLAGKTTTGKAVDAMRALAYINQPTGISVVVH